MKNTETWEGQRQGEASTTLSLEASRGWTWGTVPFYSLLRLVINNLYFTGLLLRSQLGLTNKMYSTNVRLWAALLSIPFSYHMFDLCQYQKGYCIALMK